MERERCWIEEVVFGEGVGVRRERERRCKGVVVRERVVRRERRVGEGGSWRFASWGRRGDGLERVGVVSGGRWEGGGTDSSVYDLVEVVGC